MLRGYITNLGAYTYGQLKGEWINFPITDEELANVMERIGNPEEYFFTDWDNDICDPLGEFENINHHM